VIIKEIKTDLELFEICEKFHPEKDIVFLDSSDESSRFSRYSFLFFNPFLKFTYKNGRTKISTKEKSEILQGNPFLLIDKLLKKYHIKKNGLDFPSGAAVGYISYDAGNILEKINIKTIDELNWPEIEFCFYKTFFVFDHSEKKLKLVSIEKETHNLEHHIEKFFLNQNRNGTEIKSSEIFSNFTKSEYIKAIKKIKRYIEKGDVYQVNLSQRFYSKIEGDAFCLYKKIREKNKVPYGAYIKFDNREILCFSMERFLGFNNDIVETRPIKGTAPRGETTQQDRIFREKLLSSKKDIAELVMIVDLERNDLGRVCEYGSVYVEKLYEIEKYATVYHLVSTVRGKLKKNKTQVDCLKACFPGGSITGAPKIRSMEIISELEKVKRNVYCGTIGYFGFNGISDFNIAIRTILIDNGRIVFNAGGGITYDSDPEKEYIETINKVKTFFEVFNSNASISKWKIC